MTDVGEFLFVGDRLWLDFVNTEKIAQGRRVDLLPDAGSVSAWLAAAGLGEAAWPAGEMERLRAFRASLRHLAECLAGGEAAPPASLEAINAVLAARTGYAQVMPSIGAYREQLRWQIQGPMGLLAPVAEDAARLLWDGDLALVGKCENPNCILFFYDTTKNHTRRWCSMAGCGNRAKAAAHYRRTRQHERQELGA